jgi:hypothetical protein
MKIYFRVSHNLIDLHQRYYIFIVTELPNSFTIKLKTKKNCKNKNHIKITSKPVQPSLITIPIQNISQAFHLHIRFLFDATITPSESFCPYALSNYHQINRHPPQLLQMCGQAAKMNVIVLPSTLSTDLERQKYRGYTSQVVFASAHAPTPSISPGTQIPLMVQRP